MPDREKVIKGLENCTDIFKKCEDGCPYYNRIELPECNQLKKDALALLKEHEELQNAYGYLQTQFFEVQDKQLKEQEAVVRCKECKHYRATPGYCAYDRIWQENKGHVWGMYCKPDWFCADGERK